jgi:hypothetical protein
MLLRTLCCAIVAALVASPLAAADKNDKNTKNTKNLADKNVEDLQLAGKKGDILPGFKLPKGMALSAEQQEKLKAIKEQVAPKLGELQKQIDAVVTKERRQAQAEAMGKAKAEGKNKNEVLRAGQEALALKDDEAAKLKQLNVERGTILKQVRQQLEALLTDEQKAKLAEIKGKGVDKNKNLKPDKGVKSGKGQRADKNLKPGKGAAPDKNTKNVKGASK